PKVNRAKESLESIISKNYFSTESIFEMLDDRTIANNNDLPETGIGMEWESVLSPIFIKTEKYGTRCSTVLLIDKNNQVTFEERSYIPSAKNKFEFTVE
ncbi:NRDE family protein, partial [Bacteroidales bacterium AH-315-I05]|nr:NRDE family protein [Bacteroidales bacterium AH-315-I05]